MPACCSTPRSPTERDTPPIHPLVTAQGTPLRGQRLTPAQRAAHRYGSVRQPPRTAAVRQPGRHHHRILRLLHLRHRGGAGLSHAVLSRQRRHQRDAAILRHLRARLLCPSARFGAVWPLWRPRRSQGHAGGRPADHGALHPLHRPAAHPCPDRPAGTAAAGAVPLRPRSGAGRRVGRRDSARHRERASAAPCLVWHVPAAGRADRLHPLWRLLSAADPLSERCTVLRLGLAHPLSGQQPAGGGGTLGAAESARDACIPACDR
jgi:hypothetical protein